MQFLPECILEFLWLDGSDISAESKRIGLERRGQGKGHSLGLSWHLSQQGDAGYRSRFLLSPYLPKTKPIAVHKRSLDADFPFLFQTPQAFDPGAFFKSPDQLNQLPILKQIRLFSKDPQRLKPIADLQLTLGKLPRPGSGFDPDLGSHLGRELKLCRAGIVLNAI